MGEVASGWELAIDQNWGKTLEKLSAFVLRLDFYICLEWILIFDVSFT